jgi:hypothetical protein
VCDAPRAGIRGLCLGAGADAGAAAGVMCARIDAGGFVLGLDAGADPAPAAAPSATVHGAASLAKVSSDCTVRATRALRALTDGACTAGNRGAEGLGCTGLSAGCAVCARPNDTLTVPGADGAMFCAPAGLGSELCGDIAGLSVCDSDADCATALPGNGTVCALGRCVCPRGAAPEPGSGRCGFDPETASGAAPLDAEECRLEGHVPDIAGPGSPLADSPVARACLPAFEVPVPAIEGAEVTVETDACAGPGPYRGEVFSARLMPLPVAAAGAGPAEVVAAAPAPRQRLAIEVSVAHTDAGEGPDVGDELRVLEGCAASSLDRFALAGPGPGAAALAAGGGGSVNVTHYGNLSAHVVQPATVGGACRTVSLRSLGAGRRGPGCPGIAVTFRAVPVPDAAARNCTRLNVDPTADDGANDNAAEIDTTLTADASHRCVEWIVPLPPMASLATVAIDAWTRATTADTLSVAGFNGTSLGGGATDHLGVQVSEAPSVVTGADLGANVTLITVRVDRPDPSSPPGGARVAFRVQWALSNETADVDPAGADPSEDPNAAPPTIGAVCPGAITAAVDNETMGLASGNTPPGLPFTGALPGGGCTADPSFCLEYRAERPLTASSLKATLDNIPTAANVTLEVWSVRYNNASGSSSQQPAPMLLVTCGLGHTACLAGATVTGREGDDLALVLRGGPAAQSCPANPVADAAANWNATVTAAARALGPCVAHGDPVELSVENVGSTLTLTSLNASSCSRIDIVLPVGDAEADAEVMGAQLNFSMIETLRGDGFVTVAVGSTVIAEYSGSYQPAFNDTVADRTGLNTDIFFEAGLDNVTVDTDAQSFRLPDSLNASQRAEGESLGRDADAVVTPLFIPLSAGSFSIHLSTGARGSALGYSAEVALLRRDPVEPEVGCTNTTVDLDGDGAPVVIDFRPARGYAPGACRTWVAEAPRGFLAVRVNITFLDSQFQSDYLKIVAASGDPDGARGHIVTALSGQHNETHPSPPRVFDSPSPLVSLHFTADQVVQLRGFTAELTPLRDPGPKGVLCANRTVLRGARGSISVSEFAPDACLEWVLAAPDGFDGAGDVEVVVQVVSLDLDRVDAVHVFKGSLPATPFNPTKAPLDPLSPLLAT